MVHGFAEQDRIGGALGQGGLEVAVTARNLDASSAPYGFGRHPHIAAGTALVDEAVLTVPARDV
ncbi:hypothetical protein AB0I77_19890 [Streptomyces sp. NPDC050619]|uniref:hypothetical protein n=1 Tax=Streptomyces sp. NPDC050619 TaxID=3157214 RepID=UPI003425AFDD